MARGTDLHCYYQRGVNWATVSDIHFAWIKVTDGGSAYTKTVSGITYRPDTLIAGARSRGIPVGGYCYAQPESTGGSPEHQADVLAAECLRLNAVGVAPMMDLEEPGTVSRDFGERSCNQLVARGFRPAVYMNSSTAKVLRPDQWNVPGLVIVIARYGARPETPGGAQYTGRYDVHQYASDGFLPGSAGAVDLDESYTTTLLNPILQEAPDMDSNQATQLAHLDQIGQRYPTDRVTGGLMKDGVWWADYGEVARATLIQLRATDAKIDALAAALAAATKNPDITLDAVKQIVTDAVKQNIAITGDVHIGPAAPAAG